MGAGVGGTGVDVRGSSVAGPVVVVIQGVRDGKTVTGIGGALVDSTVTAAGDEAGVEAD